MSQVIDTTQMYLRTIYELLEEGVPPLRARIAERMQHSGPTVSQTVSRMERDGLLVLHEDRRILLTDQGMRMAAQVMRRHRLAERLLVDVIGLAWEAAHDEACKWEHVIGDAVETKLIDLLSDPGHSVYGTPIPRRGRPVEESVARFRQGAQPLSDLLKAHQTVDVRLIRIGEFLQRDTETLTVLGQADARPGTDLTAMCDSTCLTLVTPCQECRVDVDWADHMFVAPVD